MSTQVLVVLSAKPAGQISTHIGVMLNLNVF